MTEDLFFQLLPFAAATVFTVLAWRHYVTDNKNAGAASAAASWPTVPGRIQSSDVVKRIETQPNAYAGETKFISYEAKVVYDYSVDGLSFTGNRLNFRRDHYSTEAAANAATAKFPAGATADVAYDPTNPAISVLDRDAALPKLSSKTWQMLCIAAIFLAVGFYIAYQANKG